MEDTSKASGLLYMSCLCDSLWGCKRQSDHNNLLVSSRVWQMSIQVLLWTSDQFKCNLILSINLFISLLIFFFPQTSKLRGNELGNPMYAHCTVRYVALCHLLYGWTLNILSLNSLFSTNCSQLIGTVDLVLGKDMSLVTDWSALLFLPSPENRW